MTGSEQFHFRRVLADFKTRSPELLLVTEGLDSEFGGGMFDYLGYFAQDEAFEASLAQYSRGPKIGHLRLYFLKQGRLSEIPEDSRGVFPQITCVQGADSGCEDPDRGS
jgi:hypothetical protein